MLCGNQLDAIKQILCEKALWLKSGERENQRQPLLHSMRLSKQTGLPMETPDFNERKICHDIKTNNRVVL